MKESPLSNNGIQESPEKSAFQANGSGHFHKQVHGNPRWVCGDHVRNMTQWNYVLAIRSHYWLGL